jgi:hypothetical protein
LVKVVFDVSNVASDNGLERGGLRVPGVAGIIQGIRINMFDDVRKVFIGVVPCVNKIAPRLLLIVLNGNRVGLSVFEYTYIRLFLHAHNALMIIACRINQMTQDFFERPLVIVLLRRYLTFCQCQEAGFRPFCDISEFC